MRILRRLLKMYTGIRHVILLFVTEYFAMYSSTRVMCCKSSAVGLMSYSSPFVPSSFSCLNYSLFVQHPPGVGSSGGSKCIQMWRSVINAVRVSGRGLKTRFTIS